MEAEVYETAFGMGAESGERDGGSEATAKRAASAAHERIGDQASERKKRLRNRRKSGGDVITRRGADGKAQRAIRTAILGKLALSAFLIAAPSLPTSEDASMTGRALQERLTGAHNDGVGKEQCDFYRRMARETENTHRWVRALENGGCL